MKCRVTFEIVQLIQIEIQIECEFVHVKKNFSVQFNGRGKVQKLIPKIWFLDCAIMT